MGFIVIIPFAALAGWTIFSIARRLRRGGYDWKWWRAFALLACAGSGLGVWFACFLQYKVANTRLEGFPIPVQISSRETPTSPWVTSNMPTPIRLGGTITNLLAGVALCLAPIAVAAFFKENRTQFGQPANPPA